MAEARLVPPLFTHRFRWGAKMHTCPGTQHGFHNNSTPRYNEAAAKLAWERTVAFFRKHLA
jgi:dienelactone hydrolase